MTISLQPLAGALGAEVSCVDLSTDLDDTTYTQIRDAFVDHSVLVFRDQNLDPVQQMAFARRFGELDEHPFVYGNKDYPHVLDVVTEPTDKVNFGGGWHSDVTFLEEPDLGSFLYAVEVPEFGGDTLFSSQLAAWDALSDTMKQMLDGLTAIHSAGSQYSPGGTSTTSNAMITRNADQAATIVEHPVVRTHPESGRKGLYVNQAFTERIRTMRQAESKALLAYLYEHAVSEQFTCRVRWRPGTLTMWDNRSVQHYALHDYAGQRRHMRRVTVKGDKPI